MAYVSSGPAVLLAASVWFVGWILCFHGVGSALMGEDVIDRLRPGGVWLYKVFSVSLGAFAASLWVFVCGIAGYLTLPAIGAFFFTGLLLCVRDKSKYGALELRAVSSLWRTAGVSGRLLLAALLVVAAVSFLAAQAPETGNDSLWYHLQLPKTYVEHGRIFYDPNHPRSLWPSTMSLLYAAGLLCQGVALAKLFSWSVALLSVCAVPAAVHYFYEDPRATKASAVFMGLIPAVWMQSLYTYTDNAMMLFTFLAFLALWLWKVRGFAPRQGFVAGMFLAALVSIKYFTLIPAAIMVAIFSVHLMLHPISFSRKIRAAFGVAAVTVLFSGFWYLRSYWLTGNPVFPFAADFFGGNGFEQRMVGFDNYGKGWLQLLALPWSLTMNPEVFGGEPMGCLFLAALPLALQVRRSQDLLRFCFWFGVALTFSWFYWIQHVRFLFPAFTFFALSFGVLASRFIEKRPFLLRGTLAGIVLLSVVQWALCLYYPARMLRGALGLETAAHYLRENERSFAFLETIEPLVGAGDTVLFLGEARLFYSPVPAVHFNPGARYAYKKAGLAFEGWQKDNNITHVLTRAIGENEAPPETFLEEGESLGPDLVKVTAKTVRAEDGVFTYALWSIGGA